MAASLGTKLLQRNQNSTIAWYNTLRKTLRAGPWKPVAGGDNVGEKLLLVEDEAAIQSILAELLVDAGYRVEVAGDGLEGITKFREQPFALVLLDILLPKIDGYTLCEMIRRESDVPVIMLTALDEEEAQVKAFQLKADDYITKPFSLKLVLMRVEAVLRRASSRKSREASSVLSYGNIQLDRESHCVWAGGKPVALTHTEYGLLELFLLHPGRVFTRDNLLNAVWGYDFAGEEKAVNIHIMNLRRKLDTDLIETVRGVGYKLGKKD